MTRRRDITRYLHYESPLPAAATSAAVLTGTAWHGPLNSSACDGCRGTCAAPLTGAVLPLARCDCGPQSWGVDCGQHVLLRKRRRRCAHNDSDAWSCFVPTLDPAIAQQQQHCRNACSGRGECVRGRCKCFVGYVGEACEAAEPGTTCFGNCSGRGTCDAGFCRCTPPFWGIDCAHASTATPTAVSQTTMMPLPRCTKRPCVYVYELPARMNVLGEKHNPAWRTTGDFKYRMPALFLGALLRSRHRTLDAREADWFYVPVIDWEGCWGPLDGFYRAHRYVSTFFPWWNATGGADHVWSVSRDAGACDSPFGSLTHELRRSVVLTHWGAQTGLDGEPKERCFRAGHDVVVPAPSRAVERSPFWADAPKATTLPRAAAAAAAAAAVTAMAAAALAPPERTTQLFFSGALCWSRMPWRAKDVAALERKCNASWKGGGTAGRVVRRYAFGLRIDAWRRHRHAPGFMLLASDFPPSLPPKPAAATTSAATSTASTASASSTNGASAAASAFAALPINEQMLRSRYCLAPSGAGWGMRAVHAAVMGCVPVMLQHDGSTRPPVAQAFEPSAPLDWSTFGVSLRQDDLPRLPQLLDATDLRAKQAALRRVWTRLVWREALPPAMAATLPGPDAFDTVMEVLGSRAKVRE